MTTDAKPAWPTPGVGGRFIRDPKTGKLKPADALEEKLADSIAIQEATPQASVRRAPDVTETKGK